MWLRRFRIKMLSLYVARALHSLCNTKWSNGSSEVYSTISLAFIIIKLVRFTTITFSGRSFEFTLMSLLRFPPISTGWKFRLFQIKQTKVIKINYILQPEYGELRYWSKPFHWNQPEQSRTEPSRAKMTNVLCINTVGSMLNLIYTYIIFLSTSKHFVFIT